MSPTWVWALFLASGRRVWGHPWARGCSLRLVRGTGVESFFNFICNGAVGAHLKINVHVTVVGLSGTCQAGLTGGVLSTGR